VDTGFPSQDAQTDFSRALVVSQRYLLMRTHDWDTGVLDRVARQLR
jgi:hypothetical protein